MPGKIQKEICGCFKIVCLDDFKLRGSHVKVYISVVGTRTDIVKVSNGYLALLEARFFGVFLV